jgi:multiple sugar transport system substrate-binding protein
MSIESHDHRMQRLLDGLASGRLTRREALLKAAALGLSASFVSRLAEDVAAQESLLDSDPAAKYEGPVTKERVAYLKTNPYKGVTINVMALKATVGDAVSYHAPRWEEETGAHVNVAQVPIETLHQQIFTDLSTGLNRYDAYQTGAWFYGDFFVPQTPYIVPLTDFLKDPRYPYWDPKQVIPSMAQLYTWGGEWYGVLFDADAQILYYRDDVFNNKDIQKKYEDKMGAAFPNPPKTMKEMHDVADFFTGWDWNGDGQNDWGISLHAKVNEQGFFHFLTLAAPYVISKDNKFFWFNPDTMEPLINSDGHVLALEDYAKFVKDGPQAMLSWTLGEGWNLFLAGNSAMEPTWGDLPTLAQDPKSSKVQGKVGAAPIPGTTQAYDPITKKTTTYDLNQVANVNGGSWHGVISQASKHKEATYDFLAFMANQKNEFYNITHGTTGVQPGVKYAFLPPYGTASVQDYVEQGWNAHDVTAFTNAYYEGLVSPLQESYLRIPGTAEYWHELDVRVSAVLAGQTQPKAALDDLYQAWVKITDRYGKDKQLKIYQDSIGYKK